MPHRRTFLKNLSIGTGSLLFPKIALGHTSETKKIGVALVGLGNYATHQLAPALLQTQRCRLAGIVTGSPEKAEKWKQDYNIPAANVYNYQTFDRIKDNPDIDVVYVVLPNALHAEYSIRAAQAGKHVICEKPMALNPTECKAIIDACQTAGVKLSVGYRLYFEPHHLEMRRLGMQQVYGGVKMIESSLGFSMANPKSWRLDAALGGGGAIMDLGVYCIQGARRTVGELPVSVTAQGYVRNRELFRGIYEMMTFQLAFPGGAVANATTTYTSYVDRLHATTDWRWFGLNPCYNATGAKGEVFDGNIMPLTFETPAYQQIAQMDAFAESILDNKPVTASGEEGLIDLRIIEAIKQAADSERSVSLRW
jgi:predicted dehydrogenase